MEGQNNFILVLMKGIIVKYSIMSILSLFIIFSYSLIHCAEKKTSENSPRRGRIDQVKNEVAAEKGWLKMREPWVTTTSHKPLVNNPRKKTY